MKNYILPASLILFLIFCDNNAAKKKLETENTKHSNSTNHIIGIGKIIPENDIIQLASPVNGIVQAIYKRENDSVAVGTIILELVHQLEDQKFIHLSNQITTHLAQIKVDLAGVGELEAKITNAQNELHHLQSLLLKGAETQQMVDNASTNLITLTANLNKLQAAVGVTKSRWQEAKTNLKTAQLEKELKIIKSPVNGKILELTVLIGSSVSMQQTFAQISPEGKTIVICEIDELNASKIVVGQQGWIRGIGSSDTLSSGTVYFTSSFLKKKSLFTDQSGEKQDRRVRTIKMLLNNPETLLLNARVECVVDISNPPSKR